jgi:hypothetical protein
MLLTNLSLGDLNHEGDERASSPKINSITDTQRKPQCTGLYRRFLTRWHRGWILICLLLLSHYPTTPTGYNRVEALKQDPVHNNNLTNGETGGAGLLR